MVNGMKIRIFSAFLYINLLYKLKTINYVIHLLNNKKMQYCNIWTEHIYQMYLEHPLKDWHKIISQSSAQIYLYLMLPFLQDQALLFQIRN